MAYTAAKSDDTNRSKRLDCEEGHEFCPGPGAADDEGADLPCWECDAPECDREGDPVRVVDDTDDVLREGVRCPGHAKDFLGVAS